MLSSSEKRCPYKWRKMQKAEMPWTFTGQGLETPGRGDLALAGVEGLLLPWAEGPAATFLWCSFCSWGMGVLGGLPGPP